MTSNTNVDTTLEPVNSFFMQHRAATTDTMLGDAAMVSVANRSYSLCVGGRVASPTLNQSEFSYRFS